MSRAKIVIENRGVRRVGMPGYHSLVCTHQGEPIKIVYYDEGGCPMVILRKKYITSGLDSLLARSGVFCEAGVVCVEELRHDVEEKLRTGDWDVEVLATEIILPRTTNRDRVSDALSKL